MRLRIVAPSQFYAGGVFVLIGLVGLVMAADYPVGTAARMGPGFFPIVLSALLAALGVGACIAGLGARVPDDTGGWPLLPMLYVIGGVTGFGLLIEPAGLVCASAVLLACACLGRLRPRPIEALVLSTLLIGFVTLLFVTLLGMPIPLF